MIAPAISPVGPPFMDVREEILKSVAVRSVVATIIADQAGIIAGVPLARAEALKLGLSELSFVPEAAGVRPGDEIARLVGTPKQVLLAEDILVGLLGKPSGIATRARNFVAKAGGRPRVVSGGWKKMPGSMKEMVRGAVVAGGASPRILPGPFAYLDKNYVELLGGIRRSLAAVAHLEGVAKVIQVKGRSAAIATEAAEAAEHGADVVFIDTGRKEDVGLVSEALVRLGLRGRVHLAFGGSVSLKDLDALKLLDLDILDVGRQIVDAPLLDMRLEIVELHRLG